jgi:hypothetical protein
MAKKIVCYGLKHFIFYFSGSLLSITGWAQTGSIAGIVADAKDKEPLIGASLVLSGTTTGAVTDIDGAFRIEGIPAGVYSLSASYVSYRTRLLQDVRVVAGEETTLSIMLDDADLQLQNVTVVAQRRLGTEMAVLNTVRNSLPVASGISAQQIARTQDSDAAEVLRRIPGITIVDDRFIVVRGLAQRYNNVWLNEAATPSGETDSRAFSFDVIPSSLIDNMMVFKSPSADLPADFSGGFVRISTKNIPEGNTLQIGWQAGYNVNASLRDFSLAEEHGKLPSQPAHLNDVSTADAAEFTRRTNTGWAVRQFTALPEQKGTLTLNRSFAIGSWRIGNITNLNYGNSYDYHETENNNYLSYDSHNQESSYRYRYHDTQYRKTVKLGALFNNSLMTERSKIELRNFFNRRATSALSQREGDDFYSDENIRRWESLYTTRTTYAGQLSGTHRLAGDTKKTDWTLGYAYANYNEPDRKGVKSMLRTSGGEARYYVSDPTRYDQNLADHSASLSANYEQSLRLGEGFSTSFRTGFYGEYKDRDFTARRFVYNLLGSGYNRYADWDYTSVFSSDNIAADKIYMKESTNKSDSYASTRLTAAAYLTAQIELAGKLKMRPGLRVEHHSLRLDGYEPDGVKPVFVDEAVTDFFPSLNLAWNLSETQLLRMAWGRSVNRPEFREIVPYVYYDFGMDANLSGKPDLQNAYTTHLDLRYEFYPSPSETVTAGVFYKRFVHPIEQTYHEAGSGLQYTYHNARSADAFGLEVDVKKQLDFVGLQGWSWVFNGAYIFSKVYFDPGSFERDRPMQGQSPYLINTGLFYQNEARGISASLLYNRFGRRIESVGVPMQNPNDDIPDIYEMPRHSLDLTFTKQVGRFIELKAGIKDLLQAKIEYKQFLGLTDESGDKRTVEQLVRSYRPGMTMSVGIAFKF